MLQLGHMFENTVFGQCLENEPNTKEEKSRKTSHNMYIVGAVLEQSSAMVKAARIRSLCLS